MQEILHTEISEGRPTIIYVSDTGSTVKERDIQPRLQKVAEQVPGAKVAILRTNTVNPPKRSAWLKEQVNSGVNVIICSQELVKVGLDLLATPTLIFYQLSFSLFTLNQAQEDIGALVKQSNAELSILDTEKHSKNRWRN